MSLEPVEIDINMRQNVSEESEKASQGVNDMSGSVDTLQKEVARLEKVIEDMSTAMAEQQKIIAASNGDLSEATARIESMQAALEQAKKELGNYRDIAEQANKAIEEGADMTEILEEVTGRLSDTQSDLVDTAESLIENQNEISEAIDDSTESVNTNSASNQILSSVIKRVCDALGIENTQIKNAVGNVRVIDAVKKVWTATTNKLTVAQKLLAAGGILAVVTAIIAAISAYRKYTKEKEALQKTSTEFNGELAKEKRVVDDLFAAYKKSNPESEKHKKIKEVIIDKYGDYIKHLIDEKGNITDIAAALHTVNTKLQEQIALKLRNKAVEEIDEEQTKSRVSSIDKIMGKITRQIKDPARQNEIRRYLNEMFSNVSNLANHEIDTMSGRISNKLTFDFGVDTYKGGSSNIEFAISKLLTETKEANKELAETKQRYDGLFSDFADVDDLLKKDKKKKEEKEKKDKPKTDPAEKADASLEKMSYDIQKRISDARVKAIHEGADRERAAAKAEYDESQAYIEKRLNEIADLEKKTGKPATKQREDVAEYGKVTKEQYAAETNRINAKSKADIDAIFAEVNARFASELDRNISDINTYYARLIAEAQKAGATIEEVQRLKDAQKQDTDRANIYGELRQTDFNEALDMERAANMESIGLTTIAEQMKYEIAKNYLEERIALLRKVGDESSNKEADLLEERLKGLQNTKAPKSITGLVNGEIFNSIQKGLEKTGMSAEDAQSKTSELFAGIQQGGATAANVIGELQGMFGGLDEGLDEAMESMGNIAQGFASGGIVGGAMAAIGEGIKMFSKYKQVDKEHENALRELALAKLELQRKYNLLLLEEQLLYKKGSNIFGTDQIRGAVNAINTYKDAMQSLKDEMRGDMPQYNPFNALFGGADDYQQKLKAYQKGIGALADVDIVTGSKKSGWGFWRKRKDVYEPLLKVYDDIIDKEGKLNTKRIESILGTHKMSDENKALLQSLLDLSKAAEDAEQQLTEYLSQTFGSLGDSLANSIVEGWKNGTNDGLEIFRGGVTDVLSDFAAQMVHTLFLKELFDGLDKDIRKAYDDLANDKLTERQLSDKITDILGGFFGGLDDDVEKANKFLDEFWNKAEAAGFERPDGQREGAKGGFANASQDSITELGGGVYAVRQIVGDIRNDNREQLLIEQTITGQLDVLVERSEHWEHLKVLPAMAQSLDNMETYGVKIGNI